MGELPATEGSGACGFSKTTEERFETIELTLGPGAHDLPELPATEGSGACGFGKTTEERFIELNDNPIVGPGKYEIPEAPPKPCVKFSKAKRGLKKTKRKQRVGPGSYNPRIQKKSAKRGGVRGCVVS